MNRFFEHFKLGNETEDAQAVYTYIDNGVVFRGTNLWILIFAIFVASLGLNVNSPAVIIGAMLISPLMGPIMGIGFGLGTNDLGLLRKSIYNFGIATGIALATSTFFFLISPLNEAHSEILARTSPNIYDVIIALVGGLAGVVATCSKQKGNVIPGVAIATALMPPLCTAGYGLATFQLNFFFGAFYLFVINTVFIALATFLYIRFFWAHYIHPESRTGDKMKHRIVWAVVLATLLPSIYFGYDMIRQNRFTRNANRFINSEARFPNNYLLNKKIEPKERKISLVFGGEEIEKGKIEALRASLTKYNLDHAQMVVRQGFAYLTEGNDSKQNEELTELKKTLDIQQEKLRYFQGQADSTKAQESLSNQLFKEIKAQLPSVKSSIIQPARLIEDTATRKIVVVLLTVAGKLPQQERKKLENWIKVRLGQQNIKLVIQ